jgi:DNA end-binding protein Ku
MWRGAIQFGLVTIPVKLYLATEPRKGISFNLLHAEDERRIQMKVHCPEHGEIARSDTVRGYEWSKGQYVIMEEGDFEAIPLKTLRSIEIEQFVPARRDRQGSTFVKQSYYLEPEPVGRKAFGLLKTVLADSELQAVCKIVLKDREQLAALDPFGPTMLLSTLYWPDEVRNAGDLDIPEEEVEYKQIELDMARQLVDALTGEFDESRYHDEYREALMKVIDAKVAGQPVEMPVAQPESSKLTDLMAVLEASVAAARAETGEDSAPATAPEAPVSVATARKAKAARGKAAKAKTAKAKGKPTKAKISKSKAKSPTRTAATRKRADSASATSTAAGRQRKTA